MFKIFSASKLPDDLEASVKVRFPFHSDNKILDRIAKEQKGIRKTLQEFTKASQDYANAWKKLNGAVGGILSDTNKSPRDTAIMFDLESQLLKHQTEFVRFLHHLTLRTIESPSTLPNPWKYYRMSVLDYRLSNLMPKNYTKRNKLS